jgi:hypothetical protein
LSDICEDKRTEREKEKRSDINMPPLTPERVDTCLAEAETIPQTNKPQKKKKKTKNRGASPKLKNAEL